MKITINKPCHENWDAMTPNAQGAFCKSCAKDVVDFSKMGIAEIKSFFNKPQGKVCGRFEEKQLQELSFDDFFAKFTYWSFTKKFAAIFFMAFGFWIFSNSGAMAQYDNRMMKGEVAYVPEKKSTPKQEPITKEQTITCEKKMIMGKMKAIKHEPEKQEPMIMGGIAPMPEETKKPETVTKGNAMVMNGDKKILPSCEIINAPVETTTNTFVLGQAVVKNQIDQKETLKTDPIQSVDSTTTRAEKTNNNINQMKIYPNPSNGNFTLETNVSEKQVVSMYDENGKLVLIQSITGTSTINASNLNNGIYNMIITGAPSDGLIKKRIVIVK